MPLPLGHAVIGITFYSNYPGRIASLRHWRLMAFIAILTNLPDLDVLIGLLWEGNGSAFHRGPTHSLIFALIAGLLASRAWKAWSKIPRINFIACFALIFSHVLADLFLTREPVSLYWPLHVYWSMGHTGWGEVLNSVFLQALHDAGIILACVLVTILRQLIILFASRTRPAAPGFKT